MDWQVNGEPADADWLNLTVVREVIYYDGPLAWTCLTRDGAQWLAYAIDDDRAGKVMRLLVVPLDEAAEQELWAGVVDVRTVLSRTPAFVVDLRYNGRVAGCWSVDVRNLPGDCVPVSGVTLCSEVRHEAG